MASQMRRWRGALPVRAPRGSASRCSGSPPGLLDGVVSGSVRAPPDDHRRQLVCDGGSTHSERRGVRCLRGHAAVGARTGGRGDTSLERRPGLHAERADRSSRAGEKCGRAVHRADLRRPGRRRSDRSRRGLGDGARGGGRGRGRGDDAAACRIRGDSGERALGSLADRRTSAFSHRSDATSRIRPTDLVDPQALVALRRGTSRRTHEAPPEWVSLLKDHQPAPEVLAKWWSEQDPTVQHALLSSAPGILGSLGGLPPAIRVAANRANAAARIDVIDSALEASDVTGDDRAALERERRYLRAAVDGEVQLYLYDPNAETSSRWSVSPRTRHQPP